MPNFNPSQYPARLQEIYRQGAMYWPVAVQTAKEIGYKQLDKLTDLVFYMHHPELHGRPINAGETTLANEWVAFRSLIRPALDYNSKPSGGSGGTAPSLRKLLADADLKALGGSVFALEHRSKLRAFLARAMAGEKLDDSYWVYLFYDAFGRRHLSWEKYAVLGLERNGKKHVVRQFEERAGGAKTPEEAAKALKAVEWDLFQNTNVVLRWALETLSDQASVKGAPEKRYFDELYQAVTLRPNESVYSVYDRKIITEHKNYHASPTLFK